MVLGGRGVETKLCPGLHRLKWQLLLFFLATTGEAFFFPGLVPLTYCEEGHPNSYCKSSVQVYADKLYTMETVTFYDYDSFDFCQDSLKRTPSDTLGQILSGEQITSCPYKFSFNKEETCRKVCIKSYAPDNEDEMNKLAFLKKGIKQDYYQHWVIDNTQVIWCYDREDGEHHCVSGFPIGCFKAPGDQVKGSCLINPEFNKNNSLYLFNHLDITITYHIESDTTNKVAKLISSRVDPKSYKHSDEDHLTCSGPPMEIPEEATENLNVIYTYSVKFEETKPTEWSSEGDYDLETTTEANLQWIRLVNSFFVVLSLCGLVIILILRSICRDIAKFNRVKISVYDRRQFGWRLIHGSVFRLPEHRMLLSILLGQGTQVFIMTFLSLFLAGLGFLTPADQNVLVNYGVVLWLVLEIPAGYVSAKMYRTFKGVSWKMHFLLTTLLFPGRGKASLEPPAINQNVMPCLSHGDIDEATSSGFHSIVKTLEAETMADSINLMAALVPVATQVFFSRVWRITPRPLDSQIEPLAFTLEQSMAGAGFGALIIWIGSTYICWSNSEGKTVYILLDILTWRAKHRTLVVPE